MRDADSLAADLRRLEAIVRQLESDDSDLDRSLALFEEGVARLRTARERLAAAESRIEKVLEGAGGEIRLVEEGPGTPDQGLGARG